MPASTIRVTGDQRDALYAQVRSHLAALSDVFTAMEHQGDFATAERLGKEFAKDFRLLEDLGWYPEGSREQFELTMPPEELVPLMRRLRDEAKGGLIDAIKEREAVAGDEIIAEHESTMRACEAVLIYLDPEPEKGRER
jgi:hypothetical protein